MKIYRLIYGEQDADNYTEESYHAAFEAAKAQMIRNAEAERDEGEDWYDYTWRHIEELTLDADGNADGDGWKTVLECEDLDDLFPKDED